ncbi:hypothetical protein IFVP203_C2170019 [Vibrio parahaemolyticus]
METAIVLFVAYLIVVVLILMKPIFKYLLSLRGVKVTYVNKLGDAKTKVVYFAQDDPLYKKLKSRGEL